MEWVGLAVGILTLVPVAYFLYSRIIRRRHRVDFQVANVSLARVVSPNPRHHDKLALVTYGLTFVNSGPDPVTLKEVLLRYRFETTREAHAEVIPTGNVHGKTSVAMTNGSDKIILAWSDLRDALLKRNVLPRGGTISGSAVFFLDAPVDRYRDVSRCALLVRDYSGNESRHTLPLGQTGYNGIERGMVLVDARFENPKESSRGRRHGSRAITHHSSRCTSWQTERTAGHAGPLESLRPQFNPWHRHPIISSVVSGVILLTIPAALSWFRGDDRQIQPPASRDALETVQGPSDVNNDTTSRGSGPGQGDPPPTSVQRPSAAQSTKPTADVDSEIDNMLAGIREEIQRAEIQDRQLELGEARAKLRAAELSLEYRSEVEALFSQVRSFVVALNGRDAFAGPVTLAGGSLPERVVLTLVERRNGDYLLEGYNDPLKVRFPNAGEWWLVMRFGLVQSPGSQTRRIFVTTTDCLWFTCIDITSYHQTATSLTGRSYYASTSKPDGTPEMNVLEEGSVGDLETVMASASGLDLLGLLLVEFAQQELIEAALPAANRER